jgi:hypothetical protein
MNRGSSQDQAKSPTYFFIGRALTLRKRRHCYQQERKNGESLVKFIEHDFPDRLSYGPSEISEGSPRIWARLSRNLAADLSQSVHAHHGGSMRSCQRSADRRYEDRDGNQSSKKGSSCGGKIVCPGASFPHCAASIHNDVHVSSPDFTSAARTSARSVVDHEQAC